MRVCKPSRNPFFSASLGGLMTATLVHLLLLHGLSAGVCYIKKLKKVVHNLSVHGMKTSSIIFILPFC